MTIRSLFPTVMDIIEDALTDQDRATLLAALNDLRADHSGKHKFRSLRNGDSINFTKEFIASAAMKPLRDRLFVSVANLNAKVFKTKSEKFAMPKAWVNFLTEGGFHHPHTHNGVSWAAVYYLSVGESGGENGAIHFEDPRAGAYIQTKKDLGTRLSAHAVTPKDNMLLVFPGWLAHYVTPYKGEGERVAVAMNCIA